MSPEYFDTCERHDRYERDQQAVFDHGSSGVIAPKAVKNVHSNFCIKKERGHVASSASTLRGS
jgi:hypothetical protein